MKSRPKTLLAHFDGSVFVPESPVRLPKGKRVRISVSTVRVNQNAVGKGRRRLNYRLGEKPVDGGAKDGAENLDSYVYRGR